MKLTLLSGFSALFFGLSTSVWGAACVAPPDGLVGWWPGEGNATDIVGTNNGILQGGAKFAAGKVGQAFSLDGVNDLVLVADAPSLNPTKVTLDAWVYIKGITYTGDGMGIISKNAGGDGNQYVIQASHNFDQRFDAWVQVPTGFQRLFGETRFEYNKWYHVAETYDGLTLRIYINGELDGSMVVSGEIVRTTQPVRIGKAYADGNYFNGLIDEPEIYNRALSADEIKAIYNAGSAGKCKGPSFSTFTPRAEFTLGPKTNDDSYWVRGWLKLADTSNGIDPLAEAVTIKVGPFSHTLPAGSFSREVDSYVFKGSVGSSVLDVRITGSSTPGGYSFRSCLKKADLEATTLKPDVQLTIGDDQGQATLDVGYAKFGKGKDGQKWVFPPAK